MKKPWTAKQQLFSVTSTPKAHYAIIISMCADFSREEVEAMDKKRENILEEVSARISTASSILLSLKHNAFEDRSSEIVELRDPKGKMYDWFISHYDLVGDVLWELSRTLEEQSEKIDEVLAAINNGKEEE